MPTHERLLRSISVAMLLLAFTTVGNSTALAQAAQDTAAARAIFNEGVEHADAGDWAQAEDRFRRAYALRASPVIAFNWVSALEQLGRLLEASELARKIVNSTEAEADADLIEAARAKVETLTPRLARITLRVTGATEDVRVSLDGRDLPRPTWGVAAPTDPGEHRAVAARNGETVAEAVATVGEGEASTLDLTVPAPVQSEPGPRVVTPPPPANNPKDSAKKPLWKNPWLWAAVGVVAVTGGVLGGVLSGGGKTETPPEGNTEPMTIRF